MAIVEIQTTVFKKEINSINNYVVFTIKIVSMLQEVGQRTTKRITIGGIKESFKEFVVKYFLQGTIYRY